MTEKMSTRELILKAVLTGIEKYGIDQLTIRKIAAEAGTNIASINYHFHTKEALVKEALSMALGHMEEDIDQLIGNQNLPFPVVLEEVLYYLVVGNLNFPGITRAHLYDAILERSRDAPGLQVMRHLFDQLAGRAAWEYPQADKQELHFLLSQLMAACMFRMLSPGFFRGEASLLVQDNKSARAFAQRVTRSFVNALAV